MPDRNPYPGLRPFRTDEEHLFFGRERQVDRMIEKLAAHHFLAVVGGSGSGKSSLVNCGLRPALHRGYMAEAGANWRIAQFRPGSDPIAALARALARPGVLFDEELTGALTGEELVDSTLRLGSLGLVQMVEQADLPPGTQLLVVADQFEELFRFGAAHKSRTASDNEADKVGFVRLLLEAAAQSEVPIYVVLTMRSDFLGDCALFQGLPEAINEGQYLVPRLTRDQIRSAITGPARMQDKTISPILVTRLLNDVGDNPDQLSILQHALNRTWAHWENEGGVIGDIGLADYTDIGGMSKALDWHAEKAYEELPDEASQRLCEKVFKALTYTGTDARGIRRITPLGTLCEITNAKIEQLRPVLAVFRKQNRSFLMPPEGEPLEPYSDIDISHESLMRLWMRLHTWTKEEAQSARVFRDLRDKAEQYKKGGDSQGASHLRGPELCNALGWRIKNEPTSAWADLYGGGFKDAMNFLDDSLEAASTYEVKTGGRRRAVRAAIFICVFVVVVPLAVIGLATEHRRVADQSSIVKDFKTDIGKIETMRQLYQDRIAAGHDPEDIIPPENCENWFQPKDLNPNRISEALCDPSSNVLDFVDFDKFFRFVEFVGEGNLEAATGLIATMRGISAVSATRLLEMLAEIKSREIQEERNCLARIAYPEVVGAPSTKCETREFNHPVHQRLFSKLSDEKKQHDDLDQGSQYLLKIYANQLKNNVQLKNGVDELRELTPELQRFYQRMGKRGTETGFFHEWIEPYTDALFIFFAWPLWKLWRRWKLQVKRAIPMALIDFRRALAALFDLFIAIFLSYLIYETIDRSRIFLGFNVEVASAVAVVAFLGYLLFSDAIRVRYCRSIGKIAFDLRPVKLAGTDQGQIGLADSAKRNILKLFAWLLVLLVANQLITSLIITINIEDNWMLSLIWVLSALYFAWLLIEVVPVVRGSAMFSTRVIDADCEESRRVDAPPRYVPGSPALPTKVPGG